MRLVPLNFPSLSCVYCKDSCGQFFFSVLPAAWWHPHVADVPASSSTHDLDSLVFLLNKFGVLNCLANLRICNKWIPFNTLSFSIVVAIVCAFGGFMNNRA